MNKDETFMQLAFEEAKQSLRGGNKGFGAVLIQNDELITKAHDTDNTDQDPTAHAEIKVIKEGCKILGKDLSNCTIYSTHEPCPMCSGAIIWSKIPEVYYSISIKDSIKLGRTMINIPFKYIVEQSPFAVRIFEGILKDKCVNLYREDVRELVKKYRGTTIQDWTNFEADLTEKRLTWCKNNSDIIESFTGDDLEKAYQLLITKLDISPEEAPIVEKDKNKIVFHSKNFCPSLEACNILNLDTRQICKLVYEKSTDALVKQINSKLQFTRNYDCLRPYSSYCEESIILNN